MSSAEKNFTHSSLRERIIEHLFIGELLKTLWHRDMTDIEVLRSEFDAHGYDIVLSYKNIVRHIQLKTQSQGKVSVSRVLAEKPSGCVIWIEIDKSTLELKSFSWFGNKPGEPLPAIDTFRSSRRPTRNAQSVRPVRKNHHEIPPSEFIKVKSVDELIVYLFGDIVTS